MKIASNMTTGPSAASQTSTPEDMHRMGEFVSELKRKGGLIDTGGRMADMLELHEVELA